MLLRDFQVGHWANGDDLDTYQDQHFREGFPFPAEEFEGF